MPVDRRFERITMALNRTSNPDPPPTLDTFLKVPAEEKANVFPLTWVAEFLYRPLVFAGVGLTDQESGLWWLLAQRARNLARVRIPASGSVRILMRRANGGRGDSDREAFWATRPFGIEPVYCDDWDEGWDRIMEMTEKYFAPGLIN